MLYQKIKNNNRIPFHTPGHKRNTALLGNEMPYDIDITEIDGFDNLHSPDGILLELNKKLNKLYNATSSYALVNGSTVGILAAVNAVVGEGDTVLMARNCHKSVYNAVELAKAKTEYIMPEYDKYGIARGITAKQAAEKINDSTKLIVITSPTYEGVESEVDAVCDLAHKRNIPVLVDAAHGAHFFDKYHNADIVIRGLHKTLPALTQCAAANIYGSLVDIKQFEIKLSVFQTSSPSYVLLSSVEKCVEFINNTSFEKYYKNLNDFYDVSLRNLKLLRYDDLSKIVIFTGYTDISGFELADYLREHGIEPEMATQNYLIALSAVCDKSENLNALKDALYEIDKRLKASEFKPCIPDFLPVKQCEAYQIDFNNTEPVGVSDCKDKVSAEYIWAYPPGIPVIVPGERTDEKVIEYLNDNRMTVFHSSYGSLPQKIRCKKV